MKRILYTLFAALLLLGLAAVGTARAQGDYPESADTAEQSGDTLFTAEELDDLLAPIALYPDPLLAQILPAATFIDQIDEAARFVRQYGKTARIDDQPWDVSVKAMAHYPDVLFMMDQKNDWTVSLGQAFINQQQDVMDAIQRLRAEAQAEGNLVSTPQQEVVDEDNYISIVPAAPELVYVPQYDPLMVYMESSPLTASLPSASGLRSAPGWTAIATGMGAASFITAGRGVVGSAGPARTSMTREISTSTTVSPLSTSTGR